MATKTKTKAKPRQAFDQVSFGLNLPSPPNNPYQFTVATDCDDPIIDASLENIGGGLPIPGTIELGTDPIEVSFDPVADGEYSLTVTLTCGNDQITITQDVTISSAFAKRKRKPK